MSNLGINDISRFMNLYMMNSLMNSGVSSTDSSSMLGESTSSSSIFGSSNSILFEYLLKNAMGSMDDSTCSSCKSNLNNSNSNVNTVVDKLVSNTVQTSNSSNSSSEVYGVYGDFYPMGKSAKLSSSDINISPRIENAIKEASNKYGVEESFVKAMIKQESSFNPNCTSSAGAKGLMQLMSYNCTEYGVKNPYNIEDNVNGGVKYIKDLLDKFDGNKQLALSAYNGGITRMRNRGVDTVPEIVNMPRETRDYVSKVMGYYNQYKEIKTV